MEFEILTNLLQSQQYEKISVIGRDVWSEGKLLHLIAMVKLGEEAQLFILEQAQENKAENGIAQMLKGIGQTPRELFKSFVMQDYRSIQKIEADGLVLEANGSQMRGALRMEDLDWVIRVVKLMEAGWQLPQGHPFLKLKWEQLLLLSCSFTCPSETLPDLKNTKISVSLGAKSCSSLLEQPVSLTVGSAQTELSFTIQKEDGSRQEGICYINNVVLEDVWEGQEQNLKEAEKLLSKEELAQMRANSMEALEHSCPRGKYFVVVEYECTLAVNLQFYMRRYLDSMPNSQQGSATVTLFGTKGKEKQLGAHGLPLKVCLIQEPVDADVTQLDAELFAATWSLEEVQEMW